MDEAETACGVNPNCLPKCPMGAFEGANAALGTVSATGARLTLIPAPANSLPHVVALAFNSAGSQVPWTLAEGIDSNPLPLRTWTRPPSWSVATYGANCHSLGLGNCLFHAVDGGLGGLEPLGAPTFQEHVSEGVFCDVFSVLRAASGGGKPRHQDLADFFLEVHPCQQRLRVAGLLRFVRCRNPTRIHWLLLMREAGFRARELGFVRASKPGSKPPAGPDWNCNPISRDTGWPTTASLRVFLKPPCSFSSLPVFRLHPSYPSVPDIWLGRCPLDLDRSHEFRSIGIAFETVSECF